MDDTAVVARKKCCADSADSTRTARLKERLEKLLREAAEVEVELSRADGGIRGIPHYSVIEGRAHELGKKLSREVRRRRMNEPAACQAPVAKCPQCGTRCQLETKMRRLNSVDGHAPVQELVGYCAGCRRSFFPAT
jgi:hypothetical protein